MDSLKSANTTVVGHFNPYLISPDWLKRQGIWQADTVHMRLAAWKRDTFNFHADGVEWIVSANQLTITSKDKDCGILADRILAELPHTPVTSASSHFVFSAAEVRRDHLVFADLYKTLNTIGIESDLARWSTVKNDTEGRIEVMAVCGDEGGTFYVVRNRKADSATKARTCVLKFNDDKEHALTIVSQLLKGGER